MLGEKWGLKFLSKTKLKSLESGTGFGNQIRRTALQRDKLRLKYIRSMNGLQNRIWDTHKVRHERMLAVVEERIQKCLKKGEYIQNSHY